MTWTPTDTAQLLALGIFVIAGCCLVRGMIVSSRVKKEKGE